MWIGVGFGVGVIFCIAIFVACQHAKDLRRDIRCAIHSAAFGDFAGARRRIIKVVSKLEGIDIRILITVIEEMDDVERDIFYKLLGRKICEPMDSSHLYEYD